MEFLGFKNCMTYLLGCGLVIGTLITDRHASVRKYMWEQLRNIKHYFDLWHIKKSKSQIIVLTWCQLSYRCCLSFIWKQLNKEHNVNINIEWLVEVEAVMILFLWLEIWNCSF